MKVVKRLIAGMALCVMASAVSLKAADNSVCLHLTTGEKLVFAFENKPVMTFGEKNSLVVKDATKSVTTNAFDKLQKITFDLPAGLEDAIADANGEISRESVDSFTLAGFKEGTVISIVSINGVCLKTFKIENEKPVTVSLAGYGKGVYIISAGTVSCKVAIN